MTFRIETYSGKEQNQIVDLILHIQTKEFGLPVTIDHQPDLLQIQSFYQKGAGNFWVASDAKRVIGTIALIDIDNKQGAIRKMFVAKEYRGKEFGVAQQLLEGLIRWAREKEINEILLGTVAQFVAAHRFYEKNGFIEIPKDTLPKNFPIVPIDTKFYRLKLS